MERGGKSHEKRVIERVMERVIERDVERLTKGGGESDRES